MDDDNKFDEIEIDGFIESLSKRDVPVPEMLENNIRLRINGIKVKKHFFLKIAVSIAVAFLIFVGAIKWVPAAAAFARAIPVAKIVVDLLEGDSGVKNAESHGYKPATGLTIEKNGCRLTIVNVSVDEDRMVFTAFATGPRLDKCFDAKSKQGTCPDAIEVNFKDFENNRNFRKINCISMGTGIAAGGDSYEMPEIVKEIETNRPSNKFIYTKIQMTFKTGEVEEFLKRTPKYLTVDVKVFDPVITKGDIHGPHLDLLYDFKDIKIAFNSSMIRKSMVFSQQSSFDLKSLGMSQGSVNLKELIVSPTEMKLKLSIKVKNGSYLTGFINPYLRDDKGVKYKVNIDSNHLNNTKDACLVFMPSTYFNPKHLYFGFEGIGVSEVNPGKSLIIDLKNGIFPMVFTCENIKLTINKAKYENGWLRLDTDMPDYDSVNYNLTPNIDFEIKGYKGPFSKSGPSLMNIRADKREVYELEVNRCTYVINKKGEVPINQFFK